MNAAQSPVVAVVGSANLDIVVRLDRVPGRGETVVGTDYEEHSGGKGANQAVASARLAKTSLIASVGQDPAGGNLIEYLRSKGVDTAHVGREAQDTGRAFITVTPDGENAITVLPLANSRLDISEVTKALDQLKPDVVVSQQEISIAALAAAVKWCAANSARLILNASPSGPLPKGAIEIADPLIVNEVEGRTVLGADVANDIDPVALARSLAIRSRSVVVTVGSEGAFVAIGTRVTKIPPRAAKPVDTTGAGDEFAGTLAASLARGDGLVDAASRANAAAARLVEIPRAKR